MSTWMKIATLDRKWIYLILMLCVIVPQHVAIPIPLPPAKSVVDFYNRVESIPEGSAILIDMTCTVSGSGSIYPGVLAASKHAMKRNLKLILWTSSAGITPILENTLEDLRKTGYLEGKTYGDDYMYLGWGPGGESAWAKLVEDIWSLHRTDYYGTPLGELSIMDGIKNAKDLGLLISTVQQQPDPRIRQFSDVGGLDWAAIAIGGWVPGLMPYYEAGMLSGIINDLLGTAVYENMLNAPGDATLQMGMMTFTNSFAIFLILLGSLAGYMIQKEKGDVNV